MIYQIIQQCAQSVENLQACLNKAEQYAAGKRFDVDVLLVSRLAPDQHNLIYQIQSACDYVKNAAAKLSGQPSPTHEDAEKTIHELRERIRKTIAFVEGVKEKQYEGGSERIVGVSWAPGKTLTGRDYLLQIAIPNVFFHITTAYSILRHNGVDVGKMDYLGKIDWAGK